MICTISSRFVKVIAKAVHCLAKIGDELYVEALSTGLSLRTVNSARSAYACFLFLPAFFHTYDLSVESGSSSQDVQQKCKIAMKSCLNVFRSPQMMDKIVDTCQIKLNVKTSRLDFILNYRFGMVKTYNLYFQESETLQAVFSKDMCPNTLSASSKLLLDTISNFRQQQEEVTLISDPEILKMKNYVDDDEESNRVLLTELTLDPEEFDSYNIGVNSEITFCLKELRAVVMFAESVSQPVSLHFETAGKPIVLGLKCENAFQADFVLATLVEDVAPQSQETSQTIDLTQQTNITKHRTSTPAANARHIPAPPGNSDDAIADDASFEKQLFSQDISEIPKAASPNYEEAEPMKVKSDSQEKQSQINHSVDMIEPSQDVSCTAVGKIALLHPQSSKNNSDNEYDFIPKTPPQKKFKSAFFGLGVFGGEMKQPSGTNQAEVLASDTDDES